MTLFKDPVFSEGQKVVCVAPYSGKLTEGKTYTVVEYIPQNKTEHFTWPAYVKVLDDSGEGSVTGHAARFKSEE